MPGTRLGITISAPWDPQKIPLVLIHGLASSSEMWRELTNDILGSEELRGRYQIIHYTYATNETVLATAARFRRELREFLAVVKYDPTVSPKIVLIGHSMGGLLAKSTVVDSGMTLWNSVFTVPPQTLHVSDTDRQTFEGAFLLEPWPSIGLVVFLGTPQHGSDAADHLIGHLSSSLLHLPSDYVDLVQNLGLHDADDLQPEVRRKFASGHLTSIESLSPHYPPMRAFGDLPVVPGVPFHSIMGTAVQDRRGGLSDGYVTVDSARIPGSESDTLLPIHHRQFDRAAPLNVIYRILREYAESDPELAAGAVTQGCPGPHLRFCFRCAALACVRRTATATASCSPCKPKDVSCTTPSTKNVGVARIWLRRPPSTCSRTLCR